MSLMTSKFTYPDPLAPFGLEIELDDAAEITLALLDKNGNTTMMLFEHKHFVAGKHTVDFPRDKKSAAYFFYRLIAHSAFGTTEETKRIPHQETRNGDTFVIFPGV